MTTWIPINDYPGDQLYNNVPGSPSATARLSGLCVPESTAGPNGP